MNADTSSLSAYSLIRALSARATPRQLRLFASACCRSVWERFSHPDSRAAIELVERVADGLADVEALYEVRQRAYRVRAANGLPKAAADAAKPDAHAAANMLLHVFGYAAPGQGDYQLRVLLDIFRATPFMGLPRPGETGFSLGREADAWGNDFRPVSFDPAWRTDTAVAIARQMYDSREFGAMPILADALQDAGCDSDEVLNHCRDATAVHVRGCWVCDLVLGKV